ncbi:pilin/secretion family protein with methylation motif [Kushneria indalinina DSM 14324]|uniref:Pilin/secretion family protein with methylation motif n=1 Tax=Kushneria indalinina DSM 14324 TaxID=1122140 RepID=A0A3D9DVY9_9GAMM|nr:pilin/secretion family protein with methylation motif [Kushneria indalinina DSM 14324]
MTIKSRLSAGNHAASGRNERGVTLLEMMIALAIGSWVIIAVIGLYLAIARASLFQQDINADQQGLQYVQQFFSTRVHQASAVNAASTPRSLVLEQRGDPGGNEPVTDCAGQLHDESAEWLETIVFDDAQRLTCGGAVLLENVADLSLRYGIDHDRDHYIKEREYLSADDISAADWPRVAAVRIEFSVANHRDKNPQHTHLLYFALHQKILAGSERDHE